MACARCQAADAPHPSRYSTPLDALHTLYGSDGQLTKRPSPAAAAHRSSPNLHLDDFLKKEMKGLAILVRIPQSHDQFWKSCCRPSNRLSSGPRTKSQSSRQNARPARLVDSAVGSFSRSPPPQSTPLVTFLQESPNIFIFKHNTK